MTGAVDPYLRILVAVSLVVVVTGTVLDLSWLPLLLPAAGVLFAVGGAVAASAADRSASGRGYLARALPRLLLPFWLFAVAVVATMLTLGWRADPSQGAEPFSWSTTWLWLLPISDPPASLQGAPWMLTAWFVPTFLWLTLATPALLWLSRRWPLRLLALPVLTVLVLAAGLATLTGEARDVVLEVCVYGCCWLVGFARQDGRLYRLPARAALVAGAALFGSGLAYALWRQEAYATGPVGAIPLAALLCSLGAVLLLLRVPWRGERLRSRWPDAVLSGISARTMTVFLWTPAAAAVAVPALAVSPFAEHHTDDASGALLEWVTTVLLLLVVASLLGWADDAAAGLRSTLLGARPPVGRPGPAGPERTFVVRGNRVGGLPAAGTAGSLPEPVVPPAGPALSPRPPRQAG